MRHGDGSYDEDYAFQDRGRGPKLHLHTEVGADDIPTRVDVTGTDYYHHDATEHATCDAARCAWTSAIDKGDGPRAFYAALHGGMHVDEVLLRAARASADGVALLPGGRAHVEKVGDTTLTKDGASMHVVAWRWTGFGLTPSIEWFDDDGHPFAQVSDWSSTIREGWEVAIPKLLELEKPMARQWRESVWKKVAHTPEHGLAMSRAALRLDGQEDDGRRNDPRRWRQGEGRAREARTAGRLRGHRREGEDRAPRSLGHAVHVEESDGLLSLAEGTTTARDLGNDVPSSIDRRARWEGASDMGPQLILAGLMDGPVRTRDRRRCSWPTRPRRAQPSTTSRRRATRRSRFTAR